MGKVEDILAKALGFIADKRDWVDGFDETVVGYSGLFGNRVRRCARGAVSTACFGTGQGWQPAMLEDPYSEKVDLFNRAINRLDMLAEELHDEPDIVQLNDHLGHEVVVEVFEKAIANPMWEEEA